MCRAPPSCSCSGDLLPRRDCVAKLCALTTYGSQEMKIRDWIWLFTIIWRYSEKLCAIHGAGSISTSRFALVSMLGVATNRAAVFFRFPAGLCAIARQERSMEQTSHIEKCQLGPRWRRLASRSCMLGAGSVTTVAGSVLA